MGEFLAALSGYAMTGAVSTTEPLRATGAVSTTEDTASTPAPMSPMMTDSDVPEPDCGHGRGRGRGHSGPAAVAAHRPPPQVAVGRWSDAEHDLFLFGFDTYGREWKPIADVVRTRTEVQVRTHAQK